MAHGGLAQLARAPALQAGGQRFESVILHPKEHIDKSGSELREAQQRAKSRNTKEFHNEQTKGEKHVVDIRRSDIKVPMIVKIRSGLIVINREKS